MFFAHVFSSTGIGFLIGILLGLSASPVVGMVVGSVTALLASVLGLNSKGEADESSENRARYQQRVRMVGIRAGVFGFACVIGIFTGIYVRTHNLLSPPQPGLGQRVAELVSIGFSQREAMELVVIGNSDAETASATPRVSDSVLFAIDSENCDKMNVDLFANFEVLKSAYNDLGMEELSRVVEVVDEHAANASGKLVIMQAFVETLCAES